jgi:hypothetical protein
MFTIFFQTNAGISEIYFYRSYPVTDLSLVAFSYSLFRMVSPYDVSSYGGLWRIPGNVLVLTSNVDA